MSRTHERRGQGTGWRLPLSSKSLRALLNALFLAGCAAPGVEAPVEVTPPRAEPAVVETLTTAPAPQAQTLELEEAERERWHEIWLSAGRTPPPDLPAVLASVRESEAQIALELVRELLEGPRAGAFQEELVDLLTRSDTDHRVWSAAARTSASLSLPGISTPFAVNLESPSAARRVAAREALFTLRGAWFTTTSDAEVHLGEGPPPTEAQLATLHGARERLHEYAVALYALDPVRAVVALGDQDPQLRIAAARALAESLAFPDPSAELGPDGMRAALLERLEEEEHSQVFHVLVEGFLEHLGPAVVCTHDGRDFSRVLHARVAGCDATLLAPLAHGLARMPLDEDSQLPIHDEAGAPDACSLLYAMESLEGLVIHWMHTERSVDTDALEIALRSLEAILERPLPPDTAHVALREVLLEAIEDRERDPSIRAGAARALARVGGSKDLPRLADALSDAPTGVAYELIATITRLVEEGVDAKSEPAIAARDALVLILSRDEASLRRRALAMLATDALADLAATTDARLLLDVLEQDLPAEDSETILLLLARREDPFLVDALLSSSAFERLYAPTSGTASILTETLGRLASGHGPLTYRVARRLIELPGSEGVQRLRNALALFAALPEAEAQSLGAGQHADVIRWSLELREVAGTLAGVTEEEPPITFLERLTELHFADLERLAELHFVEGDPRSEFADEPWDHRIALLRSDLIAAQELEPNHPLVGAALRSFHAASRYASRTADKRYEYNVYRDQARFLFSTGDPVYLAEALTLYSKVFNEGESLALSEEGSLTDSFILDLADLRRAASLAAEESFIDPEQDPTAFDLTWSLIHREPWKSEPAGVRLGDLRILVEGANSQADRARVRPLFAGVPTPDVDLTDAVLPDDVPWLGLETDPEQLMELRGLVDELDAPPASEESELSDPPGAPETSEEVLEAGAERDSTTGA